MVVDTRGACIRMQAVLTAFLGPLQTLECFCRTAVLCVVSMSVCMRAFADVVLAARQDLGLSLMGALT
jgi:hypothetical protein